MRKGLRRVAVLGAAVVVGVLLGTPALAHVTVSSTSATQGGFAKLTFRVPNEKDNANTTALEVNLPTDTPIAYISIKPVPGWTAVATKTTLPTPVETEDGQLTEAVTKIVWTSSGGGIKPGEFQEFDISAGPLPKVEQLAFKALQTYSDGDIVRWIDASTGTGEVPHPAPILKLAKATTGTTTTGVSVTGAQSTSGSSGKTNAALALAIAGLVIALAGIGLTLSRRKSA